MPPAAYFYLAVFGMIAVGVAFGFPKFRKAAVGVVVALAGFAGALALWGREKARRAERSALRGGLRESVRRRGEIAEAAQEFLDRNAAKERAIHEYAEGEQRGNADPEGGRRSGRRTVKS